MRTSHFLWVLSALFLAGCPRFAPGELRDSSLDPEPDRRIIPRSDFDRDGLCDDTEASLGTRSDRIDTDDDGYSDWVEFRLATNPLRSFSPDRAGIIFLDAELNSEVEVSVSENVMGNGTDYQGQFAALRILEGDGVADASAYLTIDEAVSATPPNNINGTDGHRFLAVRGATDLNARLVFRSNRAALDCWEPLPFSYTFRRDDGVVRNTRRIMVRRPAGQAIDASLWCRTSSGCV